MADRDRVKITNPGDIGKKVRSHMEKRGSKLNSIDSRLDELEQTIDVELATELEMTREAVQDLQGKVAELERRITEIEQTKARAQRQAIEDLRDELEEKKREKKEEFERRVGEVLSDYRGSIERLKDRFLNSISGRGEQFEQVEDEFATLQEQRADCVEATESVGKPAVANFRDRLDRVIDARNEFLTTIDDFLEDREQTAATIDSLQTDVPGISGATRLTIPFWVVGIRTNGTEEIRVYPVLDRGNVDGEPTRAEPYVDRIRDHPDHGYGDMSDAVHTYASRDEVRDALADEEGRFADPGFLKDTGVARSRFVDALREFELDSRNVDGDATRDTGSEGARREVTANA